MKKTKRFLALMTAGFLAVTPMAATGLTAVADYTITVNPTQTGTHNYAAYEILKGDVSGEKLSNIAWGDNMPSDRSALLTALKSDSVFGAESSNLFYSLTTSSTPEEFANVIKNITSETNQANELAKVLGSYVSGAAKATDNTADYSLGGLTGGYYLVRDEASTSTSTPRTLNLLKVAGNVAITTKEDLPTLAKVIVGGEDSGHANTASIGDVVNYEITCNIPDMTGYDKYFFVVNDNMEEGLTFNSSSVTIKIMDNETIVKTMSSPTDFAVQTGGDADGNTFQIVFKNFIQYNNSTYIDKDIVIDYNATVNNFATAGSNTTDANTNTANLTYSNDPNVVSEGKSESEPDEPKPPTTGEPGEPGDPVGTTPDQVTYTYLTDLIIEKVDAANTSNKLAGAKFELTGTSLNSVLHEAGLYVKNDSASPAYYLLTDGTYTTTAPASTEPLSSGYASGQKYELVTNSSTITSANKVTAFGTSAENTGRLTFGKLGEGTYTIKETAAPSGYNSLPSPITVTITATPSASGCRWLYQKDSGTPDSSNTIQVQNASGATLPSTGGIGTKLFYIFGSILVAGSVIFLVTKKRMSAKEN